MKSKSNHEILQLKNIKMMYHTLSAETVAIENITLNVYDKEFISIVGPSGCGKSTILSLIAGLVKPSFGEVALNLKSKEKGNNPVGYMFQSDYLFPWRTIKENVFLGLEIKKALNEKSKNYALDLLNKYDLGKFINHYPHQLSGGMKQKAALIRTLAVNPQILLLDEPFSALDYQTRIMLSSEVKEIIKKEKKTAVLVTHDISEAITLSDRVVIFSSRPGKVKEILNIDFPKETLSNKEKRRHKKFNEYFDIIWSELNNEENKREY